MRSISSQSSTALSKRSSINQSCSLYGFARPAGVDQSMCVLSRAIISREGRVPAATASGFGLCAKALVATRGLSMVGNAECC